MVTPGVLDRYVILRSLPYAVCVVTSVRMRAAKCFISNDTSSLLPVIVFTVTPIIGFLASGLTLNPSVDPLSITASLKQIKRYSLPTSRLILAL